MYAHYPLPLVPIPMGVGGLLCFGKLRFQGEGPQKGSQTLQVSKNVFGGRPTSFGSFLILRKKFLHEMLFQGSFSEGEGVGMYETCPATPLNIHCRGRRIAHTWMYIYVQCIYIYIIYIYIYVCMQNVVHVCLLV